jgi:hypothetical protein
MLIAQKLCKVRNWTTIQSLLLHFVSFYLLKLLFDLVCYCVALIKIFVISLFICQKHAKYVFDDSVALIKIFLLYYLLLKGTRDPKPYLYRPHHSSQFLPASLASPLFLPSRDGNFTHGFGYPRISNPSDLGSGIKFNPRVSPVSDPW